MDNNKEINKLLRYDLEKFAEKLGLINRVSMEIDDKLAVNLLNIAEKYSRNSLGNEDKEKCLIICSLLWEHRKDNWNSISRFLVIIFSRLGLGPTTKMIDTNYDEVNDSYSSLGSFIHELNVTAAQLKNEVEIGKHVILFSRFQKNMWDLIEDSNRIGISAPTSAGKSFVLVNKIIDMIIGGAGKFLFIVPTISLINQVTKDIRREVKNYNLKNVNIYQSITNDYERGEGAYIYVLTQERVLSSLNQETNFFNNIDLMVIDEIQNIERVANENDERAHTMYDVIQEVETNFPPKKVIISGPRLKNIGNLVRNLFGEGAQSLSDDLPPVVNLTYSFNKIGKQIFLKQYSTINDYPLSIAVNVNDNIVKSLFDKKLYDDAIHMFIKLIIDKIKINNSGNIVFSPTSKQSINTAIELSRYSDVQNNVLLDDLIKYLKETVHPNYSLIEPLKKGIGYHNGKMPHHVRTVTEIAFSNLVIDTIVCTTTLMQGVNLPAKNIIARNPNLFTKKQKNKDNIMLTGYEFANLRGRAGRLMKDIVGRTIVLNEANFNDAQINLFEDEEKEIYAGYGERFNSNKDDILNSVLTNGEVSEEEGDVDLKIYIRHMILKYQGDCIKRFKRVGIDISQDELNKISYKLKKLAVPISVCKSNPYWDPIELNKLFIAYKAKRIPDLPNNIFGDDYVKRLCFIINRMKEISPYFYFKYFGVDGNGCEGRIYSIVKLAQEWSKEEPLLNIINWDGTSDLDEVDKRINTINSEVMYSVPKLLKPLIQIQEENTSILTFMEMGAYQPLSIRLIEYGLPRETAIKVTRVVKNKYPQHFNAAKNNENIDYLLKDIISKISHELNHWERVQLESIF